MKNEVLPFTLKFNVYGGRWIVNLALQKIRKFCFVENLTMKEFGSGFCFIKNVDVVIKGKGTERYVYSVNDAIMRFLRQFND